LDTRSGELRTHGSRIRLQAQPFQLLTLLLRNAGEVVTRDEICRELWPSNTFVDFEHSLAAAVNKIREARGDSTDDPKYIETLPKLGYRFIGKLKPEPPEVMPVTENKDGADLADVPKAATTGWRWRAAVIALAAMLLTAAILLRLRSDGESPAVMTAVPFPIRDGRQRRQYRPTARVLYFPGIRRPRVRARPMTCTMTSGRRSIHHALSALKPILPETCVATSLE
jgi:DNA-binding winged helix-turn-helix (wHTH) protein